MREELMVTIGDKEFASYAAVLDEAHTRGLKKLKAVLVQIPNEENGNNAICLSEVVMADGSEFYELGDASPLNVHKSMVNCLARVAATRAKSRALRDAVNVGTCVIEEMEEGAPKRTVKKASGSGANQLIKNKIMMCAHKNKLPMPELKHITQEEAEATLHAMEVAAGVAV